MSKLSFRARALDATKPLPIYHADDLPDLSDFSTINRTVPQMPTGMEKEEETERHLQDVIQAKQTNSLKKKHVYIPTPEAAIPVKYYSDMNEKIHRGQQYVRVPGLGLEEVPDYDLDSEDEEWLNAQSNERPLSPTHFERMMDRLEKGSGNTVLSEREAQGLLRDDENLVLAVYDYWLAKRLRLGRSLIPVVKQEGRDSGSGSNPYLAFRKRTEKMQTRKNRKNDETAYMQMLKLKRDLEKAVTLFEWVREREQKKQDLAKMQLEVFKKRYELEDWNGSILSSLQASTKTGLSSRRHSSVADWDSRTRHKLEASGDYEVHQVGGTKKKKKRRTNYYYPEAHSEVPLTPSTPDKVHRDSTHDLSSDRLEDEECEGVFSFKRKPHVKYHSCREPLGVWPWSNEEVPTNSPSNEPEDSDLMIMDYAPYAMSHAATRERSKVTGGSRRKYRFSRASLSNGPVGLARRRVGRGGRVIWDRYADKVTTPMDTPIDGENLDSMDSSAHFQPQTPASSLTPFEFTHLPFIEQSGGTSETSIPKPTQLPPFSGFSLAFRGLPLSSEFCEDAKTFSTLPTSQFFLKSLTPHVDVDYQGTLLSSDSPWGLVKNSVSDPRNRTTSEHSSPLHSPSASGNFSNGMLVNGSDRTRNSSSENDSNASKELSRSSLSVADSKTIVLSNVPLPRPKHQLEKSQRLLSTSSETAAKETTKSGSTKSENATLTTKEDSNSTATLLQDKPMLVSSQSKPQNLMKEHSSKVVVETVKKSEETVQEAKVPTSASSTPAHSDSKQSTPALVTKEKKLSTSNFQEDICTPEDYIKNFDALRTKKSRSKIGLRKKSRMLITTLSTATLITNQFESSQSTTKRKEPLIVPQNVVSTPSTSEPVTSNSSTTVANAISSLNATKLAELQSSLINNRDKAASESMKLNERKASTNNNGNSISLATSLAVTTNSHIGQALSSVGSPVATVARRSTPNANGTNYQEIFHTATRRISETAERGLKQALAGMNHTSLMENANSLVQLSNSSEVT